MDDTQVAQAPEFSVSEVSNAIKRILEKEFERVRVRGEIVEMKRYPSGHIYFSLKDESAKLSGIVWKNTVSRLSLSPENGIEVVATGRVSAYGERSSYQLIVERMEYAGVGALLARIEALRARLDAEGLFSSNRKVPIPVLPKLIGVISSEKGAVIQDILTTIDRRFPRNVILWPVAVQGEGAAEQIAMAITGFDSLTAPIRPDVLIVARGGGSLQDLMAFNDESVLRAVARCHIPLISAVGHETDTTLIDLISDQRAPTPTAAAELAVPSRSDLIADLTHKVARLTGSVVSISRSLRLRLVHAERDLPELPSLLSNAGQRLDDRSCRLDFILPNFLVNQRAVLTSFIGRVPRTDVLLAHRKHMLSMVRQQALSGLREAVRLAQRQSTGVLSRLNEAALNGLLREARVRFDMAGSRLEAVSPTAVLARGYALVTDARGRPITRAANTKSGASVRVRFSDGEVRATIDAPSGFGRQALLPF
jgi:exodeoxyribonuclease VII large subunit